MNLFDRFILTIYSLSLTALSVVVMAITLGFVPYQLVLDNVDAVFNIGNIRYTYLAVALIFFLISIKFLFQSFQFKDRKRTDKKSIAQNTEIGQVRISVNTMESIILKTARRIKGVVEPKTTIVTDDTGTSIVINLSVDGETSIPLIVEETQQSVKEQVEKIVGIEVRQIDVKITEVAQHPTTRLSRVE